jgi:hypothetical protein
MYASLQSLNSDNLVLYCLCSCHFSVLFHFTPSAPLLEYFRHNVPIPLHCWKSSSFMNVPSYCACILNVIFVLFYILSHLLVAHTQWQQIAGYLYFLIQCVCISSTGHSPTVAGRNDVDNKNDGRGLICNKWWQTCCSDHDLESLHSIPKFSGRHQGACFVVQE